jgi:hypothetical protein
MGTLNAIFGTAKNPAATFRETSERGRAYLAGAAVVVILPRLVVAPFYMGQQHLIAVPKELTDWLVFALLIYFTGKILKGNANFVGLLSSVGYARLPFILMPVSGYLIELSIPEEVAAKLRNFSAMQEIPQDQQLDILMQIPIVPLIVASVLIAVAFLWSFALVIIAARESHKFTTWRAFVSAILALLLHAFGTSKFLSAIFGEMPV